MTMILGLNLSDKIYIAADTRVTRDDGVQEDHVIKILPLIDSPNSIPQQLPNTVHLAVAGDIRLASFLYEEIHIRVNDGRLSKNIRELSRQLTSEYVTEILRRWVSDYPAPFNRRCCLLFGGQTDESEKLLPKVALDGLLRQFEKSKEEQRASRQKIVQSLENDPTMRLINQKMLAEAGYGVLESLEKSSIPSIPTHIQMAINDSHGRSGQRDSLLFCLEVKILQVGMEVAKEEAEWGNLISRGSKGIISSTVPQELLAVIELTPGREKNMPHLMEGALMSTTIMDIAQKLGADGIGGQVIITAIINGLGQIGGSGSALQFTPRGLFINSKGSFVPAVPFNKYLEKDSKAEASMLL